jgi:hypothetical protein
MKCEECQEFLDEYLDGEVEGKLAARMGAHVSGCASCSKLYEEHRQEQELYARYQRDVEVTPALWAGVEARIKQEMGSRASRPGPPRFAQSRFGAGLRGRLAGLLSAPRFSPALAAALVLAAIGLTVAVMSFMQSRNDRIVAVETAGRAGDRDSANRPAEPAQPKAGDNKNEVAGGGGETNEPPSAEKESRPAPQKQLVARAQPAPRKQPDPMRLVQEAEQKYLAAIAILSRDVNHRRSQIDPTVLARFDNALADIDRTIQDTRRVVREHPDDPVALQYLLSAYAKKVDALREMAVD